MSIAEATNEPDWAGANAHRGFHAALTCLDEVKTARTDAQALRAINKAITAVLRAHNCDPGNAERVRLAIDEGRELRTGDTAS